MSCVVVRVGVWCVVVWRAGSCVACGAVCGASWVCFLFFSLCLSFHKKLWHFALAPALADKGAFHVVYMPRAILRAKNQVRGCDEHVALGADGPTEMPHVLRFQQGYLLRLP